MNNEWLARLKEKIGKKENKEELPVRKKLLLSGGGRGRFQYSSDRTGAGLAADDADL